MVRDRILLPPLGGGGAGARGNHSESQEATEVVLETQKRVHTVSNFYSCST